MLCISACFHVHYLSRSAVLFARVRVCVCVCVCMNISHRSPSDCINISFRPANTTCTQKENITRTQTPTHTHTHSRTVSTRAFLCGCRLRRTRLSYAPPPLLLFILSRTPGDLRFFNVIASSSERVCFCGTGVFWFRVWFTSHSRITCPDTPGWLCGWLAGRRADVRAGWLAGRLARATELVTTSAFCVCVCVAHAPTGSVGARTSQKCIVRHARVAVAVLHTNTHTHTHAHSYA